MELVRNWDWTNEEIRQSMYKAWCDQPMRDLVWECAQELVKLKPWQVLKRRELIGRMRRHFEYAEANAQYVSVKAT
jgi:hypothetical protein